MKSVIEWNNWAGSHKISAIGYRKPPKTVSIIVFDLFNDVFGLVVPGFIPDPVNVGVIKMVFNIGSSFGVSRISPTISCPLYIIYNIGITLLALLETNDVRASRLILLF